MKQLSFFIHISLSDIGICKSKCDLYRNIKNKRRRFLYRNDDDEGQSIYEQIDILTTSHSFQLSDFFRMKIKTVEHDRVFLITNYWENELNFDRMELLRINFTTAWNPYWRLFSNVASKHPAEDKKQAKIDCYYCYYCRYLMPAIVIIFS